MVSLLGQLVLRGSSISGSARVTSRLQSTGKDHTCFCSYAFVIPYSFSHMQKLKGREVTGKFSTRIIQVSPERV